MKKFFAIVAFGLMMLPALAQNHTGYKLPDEPKRAKYIDFPSQDKGLWFAVQGTPVVYFGDGVPLFGAQADVIAGYRFGEFFKVGAGVSPGWLWGAFSMPVYLDLRGNLISQESRMAVPYWSLDAGYNVGQRKGLYASPTVGVRVGMPRNDFLAGVTYILQTVPGGIVMHGVGLRIGYEF